MVEAAALARPRPDENHYGYQSPGQPVSLVPPAPLAHRLSGPAAHFEPLILGRIAVGAGAERRQAAPLWEPAQPQAPQDVC